MLASSNIDGRGGSIGGSIGQVQVLESDTLGARCSDVDDTIAAAGNDVDLVLGN